MKKYEIIYADPPWYYYGNPDKPQAAGKHYNLMTTQEIAALPVQTIAAKPSVVLVWSTASKIKDAITVIESWGFYFRGVHQVWVKTTKAGKIIHGQGVRPSAIKPTAEYLLWGATSKQGRPLPILSEKLPHVVLSSRPGGIHSKKPAIFRDMISELWGDWRPRIELFAREKAEGWDAWGDELEDSNSPFDTLD